MRDIAIMLMCVATITSCSKDEYEVSPTYLESQMTIAGDYTTYYVVNARDMVGETLVATYQGIEYTTNEMPLSNGDNFIFPITYPNLAVTLDSNIPTDEVTFNLGNLEL